MTKAIQRKKPRIRKARSSLSPAKLAEMVEAATVDAYGESEQATGWFTMLDEHLDVPFDTTVLGVRVTVARIEQRDDDRIVAQCKRGREKLTISITELPLPTPKPDGAEWIEAYRRWLAGP